MVLMTATPYRRDGRGLADVVDALVEATTPREGFEEGWLVDPVVTRARRRRRRATRRPRRKPSCRAASSATSSRRGASTARAPDDREVREQGARSRRRRALPRRSGFRAEHIDGTMSLAARSVPTGAPRVRRRGERVAARARRPVQWRADARRGIRQRSELPARSRVVGAVGVGDGRSRSWTASRRCPTRSALARSPPNSRLAVRRRAGVDDAPPVYRPLRPPSTRPGPRRGRLDPAHGARVARSGPADVAAWDARGVRAEEKRGAIVLCHSGNLGAARVPDPARGLSPDGRSRRRDEGSRERLPVVPPAADRLLSRVLRDRPARALACPILRRGERGRLGSAAARRASDVKLERKRWDPSSLPPATPQEREAYLTAKWAEWRRRNEERAMRGQPPLKRGWPSVQFKVRFGEYPDWGMCNDRPPLRRRK